MSDTDIVERERNKRVADRWSELCVVGSHDFYKALFQIVREECERLRSGRAAVIEEICDAIQLVADDWEEADDYQKFYACEYLIKHLRALTGGPRE